MKLCFVDEAGDTGVLKTPTDSTQPLIVIAGVVFDYQRLHAVTHDFIALKKRLFPGLIPAGSQYLDCVLPEIKGSDLRAHIGRGTPRQRRHAIRFLDEVFDLLDRHNAQLFARIWIKGIAAPFAGRPVYTNSIQAIFSYFQSNLVSANDYGLVIVDSRNKGLNVPVSHSIFTQKFRPAGDSYDRIYELPTFAHSDNHIGLQLSDIIASAVLFPMSSFVYCTGHVTNVHVQADFDQIKLRYAARLRQLQYRYQDATGKWRGGLVVADAIAQRSGSLLFA
jgi:hypothetical protein